MNISRTIEKYLKHLHAKGFAEETVNSYKRNLNLFETYLKVKRISDIRKVNKQIILDYHAQVMASDRTQGTKIIKIKVVKQLFKHLTETNLLLINPSEEIRMQPRKKNRICPVLSLNETIRLLKVPDLLYPAQIRNRAILEILYSSALRISELLSLGLYDIDFKEKVITVYTGKGRKDRVVPIGKRALKYTRIYLRDFRAKYSKLNPGSSSLLLNCKGYPLKGNSVRKFLNQYKEKAGITKPLSPHTLRRTCATHLLNKGADIRFIQQLLGHKNLATTEAYTKIEPSELKAVHKSTHPSAGGSHDSE